MHFGISVSHLYAKVDPVWPFGFLPSRAANFGSQSMRTGQATTLRRHLLHKPDVKPDGPFIILMGDNDHRLMNSVIADPGKR